MSQPNRGRRRSPSRPKPPADAAGVAVRRLSLELLLRIDEEGAYANLLVPARLADSGLEGPDRALVTSLVYGTTRMRRALDFLVDRFLHEPEVEPMVRAALRMGAFQLHELGTPPHAAVSTTVGAVPKRARGLVNAVLRKVAGAEVEWPDEATRLSVPDWLHGRLTTDLGTQRATAVLATMNRPPVVTKRADGYLQDRGSQLVVEAVEARAGHRVVDLCAAPGGKSTGLAAAGARVVAADLSPARAALTARNVRSLGGNRVEGPMAERHGGRVDVVVADGRRPPLRPRSFDRVLVDAPCSGLGSLRRRPDARWRIDEAAIERLVPLQVALLAAALDLVAPGGMLVYSVCTLTDAELMEPVAQLLDRHPRLEVQGPPSEEWEQGPGGFRLMPDRTDTDGMAIARFGVPPES
ncbi:MAG: hypothetical protein GY929_21450 [Actinomycetia bacterium]|nr:hypothetical protein [Actinomycetes bacterium]